MPWIIKDVVSGPKDTSVECRSSWSLFTPTVVSTLEASLPKTSPHDCTQTTQHTWHGDAVDRPHNAQTVFVYFFSVLHREIDQEMSPKWPILCQVGRKTLTQSIFSMPTAEVANRSFRKGIVPFCFKYASFVPLKKSSLDQHTCPFQLPMYLQLGLLFRKFSNAYS